MRAYRNLDDNPLFERIACPVCQNTKLRSFFSIPYGGLKQKKSLDYTPIGVGMETILNVEECPSCLFVFANPRIRPEHETLVYNGCKQHYYENLELVEKTPKHQAEIRRRRLTYLPPLLNLIAIAGNASVTSLLDVGAGFGHTLTLARALGLDGYGTDIDRNRLSFCRELNLQVYSPSELDAQLPDLRFDIILTQSIIEHVVDLNAFMASVAARAKEGTVLYVNGLTPERINIERKANSFVKAHFIEHINYFPIGTLDQFMSRYGFGAINRYVLLLNNRSILVPESVANIGRTLMRRPKTAVFGRYYRYAGGTRSAASHGSQ